MKKAYTNNQENIIREKRPSRGIEADYKNSRKAAIDLFCLNCVGLNKTDGTQISAVEGCKSYSCPLWPFRPGKGPKDRPDGVVPTVEEYEEMIKNKGKD